MKERTLLILALCSAALQLEAARSPLQGSSKNAEETADAKEMPEEKKKKTKPHHDDSDMHRRHEVKGMFAKEDENVGRHHEPRQKHEPKPARDKKEHMEKKQNQDSDMHRRNSLRKNMFDNEDESVGRYHTKMRKDRDERPVREARKERVRKNTHEDSAMHPRNSLRKNMFDNEDESVGHHYARQHSMTSKKVVEKNHREPMSGAEKRVQKKKDMQDRQHKVERKRRDVLQTRIDKLEDQLDRLEKKRRDAQERDAEMHEHEGHGGHVINHGTVQVNAVERDMRRTREEISRLEDRLDKKSDAYKAGHKKEYHTRMSLKKEYESKQRSLRTELRDVEDEIALSRVAEHKDQQDRVDNAWDERMQEYKDLRQARSVKDTRTRVALEQRVGIKKSDKKEDLEAREKQLRKELADLSAQMHDNNRRLSEAARLADMPSLREVSREEQLDKNIRSGKEFSRFGQTKVAVEHRKEDLEYARTHESRDAQMRIKAEQRADR